MTEPTFERVEELFQAAVTLPPARRGAYLDAACDGDPALRAAVEELLRFDAAPTQSDGFLASPVGSVAERLREEPRLPRVAGYELLGVLGRGGMGVVYEARHEALGRPVALKMLLPGGLATADQLARFRGEAATLARLNLPNVVPVFDVGEADGRPFFTMEFVDGPSLSERMTGHPQDVATSVRLVEELARAVDAVHKSGIIHRDLKPANILLAGGVTPKITDFGIAKDQTTERDPTATGVAVGTPRYMAPEQAAKDRGPVGPPADIYALGAILYELLVGRAPFDGGSAAETITQLLNDEPVSPARLRSGLPRDLVTVCLKCLEKSPDRRYATALELADDLKRVRDGEPVAARPVGRVERTVRWCRRRPLVAGLSALSGLLGIALVATLALYAGTLRAKATRDSAQIGQLNYAMGTKDFETGDYHAALLRLVEALRRDIGTSHEARDRELIAKLLRDGPRLVGARAFDKRVLGVESVPPAVYVAVAGEGVVEVWDVIGGQRRGSVPAVVEPLTGAVGGHGRFVAGVAADGTVTAYDIAEGSSYPLPTADRPVDRVAFHPVTETLAVRHVDGVVRLWDVSSGTPRPLAWAGGVTVAGTLSDDARWVVEMDGSGAGRIWDVATRRSVSTLSPGPGTTAAAVSADARRVALAGPARTVRVWDVPAAHWLPGAVPAEGGVRRAAFSPDGVHLLLADDAGWLHRWDAVSGRPVGPRLRHDAHLCGVAFHAGGVQLVSANRIGLVRLWELPGVKSDAGPDISSFEELVALAEVLACGHVDEEQTIQAYDASQWRAAYARLIALRQQ